MMKVIKREELPSHGGIIRAIVAQENARGDKLSTEFLQQDLIHGNQFLLSFAKEEGFPLLALVCQSVQDRVRGIMVLWVHNFFLAERDGFAAADWSEEVKEFDALAARHHKVSFMTDNPALLAFLAGLGYYAHATAIVCDLTKDPGAGMSAADASQKLGA